MAIEASSVGVVWAALITMVAGASEKAVKSYLAERGLLVKDKAGKFSVTVKVPGHKSIRLYRVPAGVLDGEASQEDAKAEDHDVHP